MTDNTDPFQKLKSIGEAADSITHELNNIIAGISGFVELLLLEDNLSDDVRYMISGIKSLTGKSKAVIDKLASLNLNRSIEPSMKAVQENELIEENSTTIEGVKSEISTGIIGKKKAILVVDDNQSILKILSQTLLMRKFNVIATSKPLEGLQILQDNADNIDLVISDIVMPELSGIDLIERLMESKPDVKVIFITGYVQVPSVQKRVEKLNFPILTKPFDMEIFIDLVMKTLND